MSSTAAARVLTVCTGNICRSPFMERALQAELDRSWGPGVVEVSSAGTGAMVGEPMNAPALRVLEAAGYSADGFVARALTPATVASSDLVLTATRRHRGLVAQMHPKALRYAFTLREFADLISDVPRDAYEADDAGQQVRALVQAAASRRGMRPPLSDEDADIVDPYRREALVFDTMSAQVMSALPQVAAALGAR
jgi:low molecular weight protein-tyrosine phosphatase